MERLDWFLKGDPSGHVWTIATRVEEITEEQRQQRLARLPADEASAGERGPGRAKPL